MKQSTIFDIPAAERARDAGIKQACDNAEDKIPSWNDIAYEYLVEKLKTIHSPFMTEDIRAMAEAGGVPIPPSKRAWGGIIKRAQKNGLVAHAGFSQVKDENSHRAVAAQWRVL